MYCDPVVTRMSSLDGLLEAVWVAVRDHGEAWLLDGLRGAAASDGVSTVLSAGGVHSQWSRSRSG